MCRSQEELPLAQVEDRDVLVRQYRAFDSRILHRWRQVIVGPPGLAWSAVLRERWQN